MAQLRYVLRQLAPSPLRSRNNIRLKLPPDRNNTSVRVIAWPLFPPIYKSKERQYQHQGLSNKGYGACFCLQNGNRSAVVWNLSATQMLQANKQDFVHFVKHIWLDVQIIQLLTCRSPLWLGLYKNLNPPSISTTNSRVVDKKLKLKQFNANCQHIIWTAND